jgi:hypothetical protein
MMDRAMSLSDIKLISFFQGTLQPLMRDLYGINHRFSLRYLSSNR